MKVLLPNLINRLRRAWRSDKGQTLVEYALILAIISVIAVGIFALMGAQIIFLFSKITLLLDTAQGSH